MADRVPALDTPELRALWGSTPILGAIDVVFGECDR